MTKANNLAVGQQKIETHNGYKYLFLLIIFCSSSLLAIWPLPESIAFRHAFLIIGFISSLFYLKHCFRKVFCISAWPFWLFLSFFGWMLLHLFVFSQQFAFQVDELRSLWVRSLMATILGLGCGLALANSQNSDQGDLSPKGLLMSRWALILIFLGLAGTCIISLGHYLYVAIHTHQWINFDVLFPLYKAKPPFVIATALFMPLCFILINRSINHQASKWWLSSCILGISLSIFSCLLSNTKNGIAIFALGLIFFVINLLASIRWNFSRLLISLLAVFFIGAASYVGITKHLERNPAWLQLIANAKVGIDIDHQNYWKNRNVHPQPINEYGTGVDVSTYERTAWFTAGARLLRENPQGFGLMHHSFGWLALAKWPDFYQPIGNLRGATHSGWMDMALGIGIPGILLIWIPLFVAWYRSLFQDGIWFSYTTWTIPILWFAYLTTEVAGAHFTELLFFLVPFFCGITLQYPTRSLFKK
jgi:hypothetical protein